jgi:twitching motility protein PilT
MVGQSIVSGSDHLVKLLDSLLDAIVRLEGDALVMHVGEKPYVVTASSSMNAYRGPLAWGQVELSSRVLTFDAVSSMLVQILPVHQQQALTEFGAIEHEIPSPTGVADRFSVIAARGGEDVWLEVRRRPVEIPQIQAPEAVPHLDASAERAVSPASEPDVAAVSSEPVTADVKGVEAQEIALVVDPQVRVAEEAAADVQSEALESIVVSIPGQAAEEFELNAGSDNAIQIIDDEPQGVPTEDEVDAMLGATATALLTSGLDDEIGAWADQIELDAPNGKKAPAFVLDTEVAASAGSRGAVAEPRFELSPPPLSAAVDAWARQETEVIADPPVGTPLFSDDAVRAAAARPVPAAAVEETPVEQDVSVVAEAFTIDNAAVAEPLVAAEEVPAEPPPVVEHVPFGETWPATDDEATVEIWPADDAPIVHWHAVDPAPLVETWPVADETARIETWPAADAPIAGAWPVADVVAPIVETLPVADHILIAAAAPIAEEALVAAAAPAVAEPPFDGPPLDIQDDRAEVPAPEELSAGEFEEIQEIVDETPADADVVTTLHAGAERAVSEATSHVWSPSAAEIPMDVTPELRQPEPVAEVAALIDASPEPVMPSLETPLPVLHLAAHGEAEDETRQAVVVPLARTHIKPESASVPFTPSEDAALMHTLRVAAARGASTVYVVAQSKPMMRIDGEIGPLESEPILTAADVDRLVMELAPPRRRDALQNGPVEWLCDVPEIGRVRCLTFRDHRGPGILFRMFPPRAISADQLGLTPEVQALCEQSDGLVLVTGARASGKSTLLNAFVDLINRTRSDHLITIESQIGFVHESRRSFISQRESRGDAELAATYARAALREDPDVMMIEDLKSADLVSAALEAAESGRLVLASVPASSTIGALERLIEVFPADRRAKVRTSLATALRGVVAQVLLRRVKGGRVAAREILLNTPAVSTLVLEGKMFQLPVALDSGRRLGMVPLTDSLAAHVRDGTVHVAEAYRKALDRAALVALLKREGIDTSFAERLA